MEELLNKLIKKGWKPFGWDDKLSSLHKEYGVGKWYIRFHNGMDSELFDLRQLVSKESGLWQFVCNNGLIPEDRMNHERVLDLTFGPYGPDVSAQMCSRNYEYWLMSSAICDEKHLEQFLLENIKIS